MFALRFAFAALSVSATAAYSAAGMSVDELISRHKAAVESIATLKAKFECTQVGGPGGDVAIAKGSYARSGDKVVIREGEVGARVANTLIQSGEARGLWQYSAANVVRHAATRSTAVEYISNGELYLHFLLHGFPGNTKRKLTLEELYHLPAANPRLTDTTLEGRPCVKVEMSYVTNGDKVTIRHWHDVGHNYLITRRELVHDGADNLLLIEVSDFARKGGVEFPTKRRMRAYRQGELAREFMLVATEVEMNSRVPERDLALPVFPSGIECTDFTTMQIYPIDTGWVRTGPAKSFEVVGIDSGPSDVATEAFGLRPSDTQPRGASYWVLIGSGAILFIAACLYVRRRVANRRGEPG